MIYSANLGFPRIGHNRELKKAVENFWKGNISETELKNTATEIRAKNWSIQQKTNIDYIPSNDFSFYDQMLDTICLVGAIPERYRRNTESNVSLETYFAMARGIQKDGIDLQAMEMTKWFDTNYHYIVPEFTKGQSFSISSDKIFSEYQEAKGLGIETRPVIAGPITFLCLGKEKEQFNKLDLLDNLLPTYEQIIIKLSSLGAKDIQIDEPILVTDINDDIKAKYKIAYNLLSRVCKENNINLHITTYFANLDSNAKDLFSIDAKSYHVDLVRGGKQLSEYLDLIPEGKTLSLGVVDGRNIWINNLERSQETINKAVEKLGSENVIIAPSCSLLHTPVDLETETNLDSEIKSWLSFSVQKLSEIDCLKQITNGQSSEYSTYIENNKSAILNRKTSEKVNNQSVQSRVANLTADDYERNSNYETRSKAQKALLNLPDFPTTTIGSFPQTKEVRKARADYKKGAIDQEKYDEFIANETIDCIRKQEEYDIDVLVHGEFERNDMVEYFGEQLSGFTFTKNGWVQSYGSRCVKPPVIYGDVSRPNAMTVRWTQFAQEQTKRPVKGMLTAPVTILQWSFVRDDQPRETTCKQIALAIRDEVADLEKAGIAVIQVDEPAIREGLPIHKKEWGEYLKWAVDSFKLSVSVAEDETQIHTHMCYSEFNDIIESIARMDADVISIETSRSQMELLDAFATFKYPNEIGPGVYDIHSPRVPTKTEMKELLLKATKVLPEEKIWVNPDCGLKTRGWDEVGKALQEMVNAAKELRENNNSQKATA